MGGLDLATRRWDTPEHRPDDPRRLANGKPYPPFHDAMVAVDGDAARVLACIARRRWHYATGETLPPVRVSADPWPESLEADSRPRDRHRRTAPPRREGRPARGREALHDMSDGARPHYTRTYFTPGRSGNELEARLERADGRRSRWTRCSATDGSGVRFKSLDAPDPGASRSGSTTRFQVYTS